MSRDALIIGINQYQALPSLGAAAADAQSVAELLQNQGECRVTRLPEIVEEGKRLAVGSQTPVTAKTLEAALVNLFKPQGTSTTTLAFFYFSGHGLQREAGIREGYLATSDTTPQSGQFGISLTWLRRLIEESPIKQIVVILDCCHSGELFNFKEANPRAKDGCSRLFIAASRAYEAAYENLEGSQSVLTEALLSGLNPHRVEQGQISNHSLIDWVSTTLKSEVQQPLFEHSGGEMILTRVQGLKGSPVKARLSTLARLRQMTYGFCPYRGLEPFSEKHADYFFGREDLTESLLNQVRTANLCGLVGASSSGKTSLLKAGLIHQLRQGKHIPGSDTWTLKYFTPGQQPLRSLAAVFTEETADGIALATQLSQAEKLLKESTKGLAQLVTANLLQQKPPSTGQLWLIIDQFEDLLRPTDNVEISHERHQFVRCLLTALADPSLPFGLVISLRADAMDGLLPYPELLTQLEQNLVMVTPIPYSDLKAVIKKPAEKMGLQIDPMLLHSLMLDLTGAPGELPLLQQTLLELWRRREASSFLNGTPRLTADAYISLGGVKQVLISRAEAVYEGLCDEEKMAAERIFLALCELGEGCNDNKRRAYKSELINPHFSEELINRTLEKLVTARLVVVGQEATCDFPRNGGISMPSSAWMTQKTDASEIKRWFIKHVPLPTAEAQDTIELTHKSLIDEWQQLRQWLSDQRHVMREQRRLEISAQEWQQRGRTKHPEYLLGGRSLKDAGYFFNHHQHTLSSLALEFVEASRRAHRCQRIKAGVLSLLVPLAMVAGMAVSFARYRLTGNRQPLTTTSLPAESLGTQTELQSKISPQVNQNTRPEVNQDTRPQVNQDTRSQVNQDTRSQVNPELVSGLPKTTISPHANSPLSSAMSNMAMATLLSPSSSSLENATPVQGKGMIRFDRERIIPRELRSEEKTSSKVITDLTTNGYIMKSVGHMPDPDNPNKTIEFWVLHPQNVELSQAQTDFSENSAQP